MLLPISRLVRIAPQILRPTARKSASRRASPNAYRIAYSQPFALRGSSLSQQRSGGRVPRKSTVRASINPSRWPVSTSRILRPRRCIRGAFASGKWKPIPCRLLRAPSSFHRRLRSTLPMLHRCSSSGSSPRQSGQGSIRMSRPMLQKIGRAHV